MYSVYMFAWFFRFTLTLEMSTVDISAWKENNGAILYMVRHYVDQQISCICVQNKNKLQQFITKESLFKRCDAVFQFEMCWGFFLTDFFVDTFQIATLRDLMCRIHMTSHLNWQLCLLEIGLATVFLEFVLGACLQHSRSSVALHL